MSWPATGFDASGAGPGGVGLGEGLGEGLGVGLGVNPDLKHQGTLLGFGLTDFQQQPLLSQLSSLEPTKPQSSREDSATLQLPEGDGVGVGLGDAPALKHHGSLYGFGFTGTQQQPLLSQLLWLAPITEPQSTFEETSQPV